MVNTVAVLGIPLGSPGVAEVDYHLVPMIVLMMGNYFKKMIEKHWEAFVAHLKVQDRLSFSIDDESYDGEGFGLPLCVSGGTEYGLPLGTNDGHDDGKLLEDDYGAVFGIPLGRLDGTEDGLLLGADGDRRWSIVSGPA